MSYKVYLNDGTTEIVKTNFIDTYISLIDATTIHKIEEIKDELE